MKKTTILFLCLGIAALSSCKKDKWLDPPHVHENGDGTHTGVGIPVDSLTQDSIPCDTCVSTGNGTGENLFTLEDGAHYDINESTLYQYDENGTYTFGVTLITHQRSDVGEIKISNLGNGYIRSNIMPDGGFNDGDPQYPGAQYPPIRPWGSTTDYNHVFHFGMIGYIVNDDNTVDFNLYHVPCRGDTLFFGTSMEIVPTMESDNTIRLEQFRQGDPMYGQNERRIVWLLEKTEG